MKTTSFTLDDYQEATDDKFENISIKWRYVCIEPKDHHFEEKRYYELRFHNRHRDRMSSYLDYVVAQAKEIRDAEKVLRIYSCCTLGNYKCWESTILEHPCTSETLAMEPSEKKNIMEDLDMFVQRKDFYKHVGKAWKRGHLLYGPPGTSKSSLIAAMANYLNYNIYDLELTGISNNADLRQSLLSTTNRSILIIEDIDCSLDIQNREKEEDESDDKVIVLSKETKKLKQESVTLSGLLNFIDGLWSSCGDERIIVFTTNYKDKLDPALLRPGRMDMHIHVVLHCERIQNPGFQVSWCSGTPLFGEIEGLMQTTEVTPAQVAGQLQVSDDAGVALAELVKFIKEKKEEDEKKKEKKNKEAEAKKLRKKRLLNLFQRIKEIT